METPLFWQRYNFLVQNDKIHLIIIIFAENRYHEKVQSFNTMAFIINPDGTVKVISPNRLKYDQSGAIVGVKSSGGSKIIKKVECKSKPVQKPKKNKQKKYKPQKEDHFDEVYVKMTDKQKEELSAFGTMPSPKKKQEVHADERENDGSYQPSAGSNHKSASKNNPKYGYARDRYGRIVERDHYTEDGQNEFNKHQQAQLNYDYSTFDSQDDNDGAYDGWE